MHIAITGASGLIGRALIGILREEGHTITAFSRKPDIHKAQFPQVRWVRWNPNDTVGMARVLKEADAVVNLMGENIASSRWTEKRKKALYESRVANGKALASALRAAEPRPAVLIQASAVGYYGARGDEPVDENTPPGDDFLARLCVDWEASTALVEELGMRRAIIRTGIVLSTQGGALPRLMLPIKLGVGGPLGNGKQWMPWIHITDEVKAIAFLIANENASGPFNLTAPKPVTNAEFTKTLARKLHRPAFMKVPGAALKILLGEMAEMLLTGQRALPSRLLELGYKFSYPNLEDALDNLLFL